MMMGWGWGHGFGFGWLVPFGLVILLILVIVNAFSGRRRSCCSERHEEWGSDNSRAIEILSERYAKGEISDEEYRQKKAELRK